MENSQQGEKQTSTVWARGPGYERYEVEATMVADRPKIWRSPTTGDVKWTGCFQMHRKGDGPKGLYPTAYYLRMGASSGWNSDLYKGAFVQRGPGGKGWQVVIWNEATGYKAFGRDCGSKSEAQQVVMALLGLRL